MLHALDAAAMHDAAQALVGHHDFTTFRSSECQAASPVKTLDRLAVTRAGEEIRIEASARSFLHNQVRSMVGSLKLVGEGRWTARDLEKALQARDRAACGPVAPACGLYLVRDGWAGNLSQELSFRDEGKLCHACLKRTTADNTGKGRQRSATRRVSAGNLRD